MPREINACKLPQKYVETGLGEEFRPLSSLFIYPLTLYEDKHRLK